MLTDSSSVTRSAGSAAMPPGPAASRLSRGAHGATGLRCFASALTIVTRQRTEV